MDKIVATTPEFLVGCYIVICINFFINFLKGVRSCTDFRVKLATFCNMTSISPVYSQNWLSCYVTCPPRCNLKQTFNREQGFGQTEVSGLKAGYCTEEYCIIFTTGTSLSAKSSAAASRIQFFAYTLHPLLQRVTHFPPDLYTG